MSNKPNTRRYQHRYRRITFFFARILVSIAVWDLLFPRIGLRSLSRRTRSQRMRDIAVRFRKLAIEMGGVLIKVGQFLSSRVDVLPRDVTEELSGLQDEVPPDRFEDIRQVAETEFGMPLSEKFEQFQETPMAAASLGQVYLARLRPEPVPQPTAVPDTGGVKIFDTPLISKPVVVKIQRPHIEEIIAVDLSAVRTVGNWLQRYPPIRKRADVPALIEEFTRTLYEEIDYISEGQNAETFEINFEDDPGVRVPGVIWSHTTKRVLTLEDVQAIKITDYDAIRAAGIDPAEVASRLLNTYLTQIFEDGFFHADPHPGNLFVYPMAAPSAGTMDGKATWRLTFVDFGMVGHVPPKMRTGMRELIIGLGTQDASRVVKSYQMLGILLPGADVSRIEMAENEVFKRFWGKNMAELTHISGEDVRDMLHEFRDLLYSMPFQVPEGLIFLGRAVSILSGMCTGLDPNFNVWQAVAPFARKLISEQAAGGAGAGAEPWLEILGGMLRKMIDLPQRTDTMLQKMERGDLSVRDPQLTEQMQRVEIAVRRATSAVVFAALLLGGVQLSLGGQTTLAVIFLAAAGLALVWLMITGFQK